uniref:Putative tick transposon n=1 Tax=Rhipicephalus microplus TaxID=6941 RepID=A0A6G5ADZ9_RHIMP
MDNQGSLAKRERLQLAAKTIEVYTKERGLQCSGDKSELIPFSKSKKSTDPSLRIEVKLDGNIIPEKATVRILGMWLTSNQRCLHTLNMLKRTAQQIVRMIVRITNNRAGLKEQDVFRLVKSLVISRLTYSLPYHNMKREEKEKADKIIRMAYKAAL